MFGHFSCFLRTAFTRPVLALGLATVVIGSALPAAQPALADHESGHQPRGRLELVVKRITVIDDGDLLLVLDNFEQVVESASVIAELLAVCPRLRVVVTSRVPLRLRWERELPIAPLELPQARATTPAELAEAPAVRLFVERARADAAEARERVDAVLALARGSMPSPALARALHGAGELATQLGDYAISHALLAEASSVARRLADRRTLAAVLDSLGRLAFVEGRYADSRAALKTSDQPRALSVQRIMVDARIWHVCRHHDSGPRRARTQAATVSGPAARSARTWTT